ncbi:hypothetical protein [Ferrimonas gelatinilytica]|uniref:Uncharacterized protein n=1 Tax=Ferrimonas gelatinilytica TaxID=1255257 RepID=A0ABP9RXS4_9GAMM
MFFSLSGHACKLNPEYKKLRAELTKEVREPYNSCIKSTRAYFFYKAVAKCEQEGRGKDISGGCYHVVGYEETHDESELNHCKVLKPTTEEFVALLKANAEHQTIKRCLE